MREPYRVSKLLLSGLAAFLCGGLPGSLEAQNALYIDNQVLQTGQTGAVVPIKADTDKERHGFSISVRYDDAKLKVTAVEVAGTASAAAEFSNGRIFADDGGPELGRIQWAVVMEGFQAPYDPPKSIPAGNGQVIANLKVDVLSTAADTATITPQDGLGTPEGGWINLFTNHLVVPPSNVQPTLRGGTITIQLAPQGNRFQLGDCNGDEKARPDITDAVFLLGVLFLGQGPAPCRASCNADGVGTINVTDPIYLLSFLFQGGTQPPPPYPACDSADAALCEADVCGV